METFIEAVRKIAKPSVVTHIGVVKSIKGNACTVERSGGLPPLQDVRLQAAAGDYKNQLLILPRLGSEVLCLEVEWEKEESCIVQYTEIDKVRIEIQGAVLEVSGNKIQFKNEAADLKSILTQLFSTLKNAKILTPAGPGKFSPAEQLQFEQFKNQTKELLQ